MAHKILIARREKKNKREPKWCRLGIAPAGFGTVPVGFGTALVCFGSVLA